MAARQGEPAGPRVGGSALYYNIYYLRQNDEIAAAASIPFTSVADAYHHLAEQLAHHAGVEVWKDGARLFVARASGAG